MSFLNAHSLQKNTYQGKETPQTSNAYGGGEWGNAFDDQTQRKRKRIIRETHRDQ